MTHSYTQIYDMYKGAIDSYLLLGDNSALFDHEMLLREIYETALEDGVIPIGIDKNRGGAFEQWLAENMTKLFWWVGYSNIIRTLNKW